MKFTVHPRFTEEDVAIRLSQILRGEGDSSENCPPWQSHGDTWQLDRGNDWFLTKIGDHEYQLKYRYLTDSRREMMEVFGGFLSEFIFS